MNLTAKGAKNAKDDDRLAIVLGVLSVLGASFTEFDCIAKPVQLAEFFQ
jgi:hypothetical protein